MDGRPNQRVVSAPPSHRSGRTYSITPISSTVSSCSALASYQALRDVQSKLGIPLFADHMRRKGKSPSRTAKTPKFVRSECPPDTRSLVISWFLRITRDFILCQYSDSTERV